MTHCGIDEAKRRLIKEIKLRKQKGKSVYVVYIDLKGAYDSLNWRKLFSRIK
jgi:hypothetical protein